MMSKCLEKKVELIPEQNNCDCVNPFELEYYLVESEMDDKDELTGVEVYGIEIIKKIDNVNVESSFVKNFTCCREYAKKIVDKLAYNTVTPVGLPFVLDDILGV